MTARRVWVLQRSVKLERLARQPLVRMWWPVAAYTSRKLGKAEETRRNAGRGTIYDYRLRAGSLPVDP